MGANGRWRIAGTYFEVCNCDVPCPCRKQGEVPGGRSTYDTCDFALSWAIAKGGFGDIDLVGRCAVMVGRWDNAEPPLPGFPAIRPPWHVILYIDDAASAEQHAVLSDIFLGRAGGTAFQNYAKIIGEVHAVKSARIALEHARGRESLRVESAVDARAGRDYDSPVPITCGISGHDQPGQELYADQVTVADPPLAWSFAGQCGYASGFDYRSDG